MLDGFRNAAPRLQVQIAVGVRERGELPLGAAGAGGRRAFDAVECLRQILLTMKADRGDGRLKQQRFSVFLLARRFEKTKSFFHREWRFAANEAKARPTELRLRDPGLRLQPQRQNIRHCSLVLSRDDDAQVCPVSTAPFVASQVEDRTIWGLGDFAAWPIQGLVRRFRPEIEARINRYPAAKAIHQVRAASAAA